MDHSVLDEAIKSHKDKLLAKLRSNIRDRLINLSPDKTLTICQTRNGEHVYSYEPQLSKDYATALICFCQGKIFQGYALDSAVTPIVTETIESTISDYFGSHEMGESITSAILMEFEKLSVASSVRDEISNSNDLIKRELNTALHIETAHSVAGDVIEASTHQIHDFLTSSIGQKILLAVSKMMATTTGKVIFIQALKTAVAKVMASVALKAALLSIVRKVGVGILIKTAIGKALIALLAAVGLAHVPAAWIILPVLAGFLYYEYKTFPEKLADRIPSAAVSIIDEKYSVLSDQISKKIMELVVMNLLEKFTEIQMSGEG